MSLTPEDFSLAVRMLGSTDRERADRAGVHPRTIQFWLAGRIPADAKPLINTMFVLRPELQAMVDEAKENRQPAGEN